ncbi:MAG: threonine ammonia-lyase [Thermomicrobiales bacterium]
MSGLRYPTLGDVERARETIAPWLRPTPLVSSAALDERMGMRLFVKCENVQPIGAFKVRGGVNLMASLSPEELSRGVVTASTGNHGQSIAWAARAFGAKARIYMPEQANPLKVAAMLRNGAEVICEGPDFDAARETAEQWANEHGWLYDQPANEPRLIAGVGTYMLEILDEVPDIDAVIVPVGGGSGVCGACIAGKGRHPDLRVIGVQAEGAPAAFQSWKTGTLKTLPTANTFAEGVATRATASLPAAIMRDSLDDFRLVSDDDMRRGIATLLETTRMLAEGAGAAALAAVAGMRDDWGDKNVAIVLSGGNLTLEGLSAALAVERPW